MILRGGIFNGFGAFDASSLLISLDPKAGAGVPFTSMLQGVMQQRGASKLVPDGKWGQCSHSAFKKTFGVDPSYDALDQLFGLQSFGVPSQNVNVWKPGITDVCWNGSDAYEAPPVEQQLANPDPAFLLSKTFGLPLPPGWCTQGRVADTSKSQCVCPSNMVENVNTGVCESFESPAKMDPNTTQTKLGPNIKVVTPAPVTTVGKIIGALKTGVGVQTPYPCPTDHPYYAKTPNSPLCNPASQIWAYTPTTGGAKKCIGGATPVAGSYNGVNGMLCKGQVAPASTALTLPGQQRMRTIAAPKTPAVAASQGMSTGSKMLIGLLVLGVAGGGAWMLLHHKSEAVAVANRRRRRRHHRRHCRRNCGE